MHADDQVFDALFNETAGLKTLQRRSETPLPPIVSFVGHSGAGKTTILEKVIAVMAQDGINVAIIKHDVHGFEMDTPGKDSWRYKKAGAVATVISCADRVGIVMDADHDHQPVELAPLFSFADLILTEGYKHGPHPKIEVFRPAATGDARPVCAEDPALIAVISDDVIQLNVPVFGTRDTGAIATFLEEFIHSHSSHRGGAEQAPTR